MKKLILAVSLMVGLVGLSHAGGRAGQGWRAYTVGGSSAQITIGASYLNSIVCSTPATNTTSFVIAVDSVANFGASNFANFISTTQFVTPAIILSSANVNGQPNPNTYWSPGQAPNDFVELQYGLFLFMSGGPSGQANTCTAYYSR